jgi:alkyl hydroperoxide reductase subunit F
MSNKIIVFSLKGCGHCVILKKELNENNIPYTEIEIGENKEIWDQVVEQTGHNSLPTVFVSLNGEEDGPVFVPGRDYQNKDEIVEIIKTYL